MLDVSHDQQLSVLLASLECKVVLPPEWYDFFALSGPTPSFPDDRRRFVRYYYRTKGVLELLTTIPSIPREHQYYCIYTKDISRNGIGFLHVEQLYPGETHILWLADRRVRCTVVRCFRHNEQCFEIGATFGDEARPQ